MNLYIDSFSALYFYGHTPKPLDEITQPCYKNRIDDAVGSVSGLRGFDLSDITLGSDCLHVLVGNRAKRTSSKSVVCHVRSTRLPWGALRSLGGGRFIVSPELCFYELAPLLPFSKLVEVGYLLCGKYCLNDGLACGDRREPLTTKRKLESFASRMTDARGKVVVHKALQFVSENSASPRETKLAILLSFPVRLGGYGFDLPVMNYRIDFSPEEQLVFGRPYVVLDLYWPQFHFGIEYDGALSHAGERQSSRDRRKASELAYRGITVFNVDKDQVKSVQTIYALALKAARMMNVRVRVPTQKQWDAKQELFNSLMR